MLPIFLLLFPNSGHPNESNFIPHFIVIITICLYVIEFSHDKLLLLLLLLLLSLKLILYLLTLLTHKLHTLGFVLGFHWTLNIFSTVFSQYSHLPCIVFVVVEVSFVYLCGICSCVLTFSC